MEINKIKQAATLGELIKLGYKTKSIKQELKDNLRNKLKTKESIFHNILGYENSMSFLTKTPALVHFLRSNT